MKYLLCLLYVFPLLVFAQTNSLPNNAATINSYGQLAEPETKGSVIPYRPPAALRIGNFTGIRNLTEINSLMSADAYPWLSPDGLRLYYTKDIGNYDQIYMAQRATSSGFFSASAHIALNGFTATDVLACWLSANELNIYFSTRDYLYRAQRTTKNAPFNQPVQLTFTGKTFTFIAGPSLNSTQDTLFAFTTGPNNTNQQVNVFARISPNIFNYSYSINVAPGFVPNAGQLSKDELSYFITVANNNGFLASIYEIKRTSKSLPFLGSNAQPVAGLNDPLFYNAQASVSNNQESIAFVRASANSWNNNDLYIASKNTVNSVFDPNNLETSIAVSPNPATDKIIVTFPENKSGQAEIYNLTGKLLFTETLNTAKKTIYVRNLPSGMYIVRIKVATATVQRKFVKN